MRHLIKLIRAYQWTKSGFIFLPFIFSEKLFVAARSPFSDVTLQNVWNLTAAFIAFSFAASVVYVFNDLKDVELDRQDPRKKSRPIASGKVGVPLALGVALTLLTISLILSYTLGTVVMGIIVFYLILNLFYTQVGKRVILLDVFIIAVGYVLRVIVGAYAINIEASPWLLSTTFFIALFLGFFKRFYEVKTSPAEELIGGKYNAETLRVFTSISASLSVVTYTIYTIQGPHAGANLFWTVPLVVLGIFRFYVLMQSPEELKDGNPSDLLLADKFLIFIILAWLGLCSFLILFFKNPPAPI